MIKTILVPTDGSDHAHKAVKLASDIAEKYGARLVLLYVLPRGALSEELRHMAEVEHMTDTDVGAGPFAGSVPAAAGKLLHEAQAAEPRAVYERIGQFILGSAETMAREKGVSDVVTEAGNGEPAREILNCADRVGANLIVMGSRGLGDVKGLLMGSVSHKVSQLSPCTCVTVK